MSTVDPYALEAKARLYVGRGLEHSRESSRFAFWFHLAIEPLARAAIAQIHPVLLADGKAGNPAASQAAALGVDVAEPFRSAGLHHVLNLCGRVLQPFTGEEQAAAQRLAERRNTEMHTGDAVFEDLALSDWYTDFARVAVALSAATGRELRDFLGREEAAIARAELIEEDRAVTAQVKQAIGRANHRVAAWADAERTHRESAVRAIGSSLGPYGREHTCPACGTAAVVRGDVAARGSTRLEPDTNELYETLVVVPTVFRCPLCELQLDGRAELRAGRVGDPFTVAAEVDPVEFHGIDVADEAQRAGLYVVDPADEMGYQDE